MVLYYCPKCNKEFNKSTNLMNHLNRKRPCTFLNDYKAPKTSESNPKTSNLNPKTSEINPKTSQNLNLEVKSDNENSFNNLLLNHINKLVNPIKNNDNNTCMYCETIFSTKSNLQRHLKDRCKSKKYCDELEKIKIKFEDVMNNNEHLLKEIEDLKKENKELKITSSHIITTNNNNNNSNNTNTLNKNQINNGTINNNNLNVQLVQFVHDLLTF